MWPPHQPVTKTSPSTPFRRPTKLVPIGPAEKQTSEWSPLAISLFTILMIAIIAVFGYFGMKKIKNRRMQRGGSEYPLMGYNNLGADTSV